MDDMHEMCFKCCALLQSPGQVDSSGDTAVEDSRPTPRRSTRSSDGQDTYDEEDAEVAQVGEMLMMSGPYRPWHRLIAAALLWTSSRGGSGDFLYL